MFKAVSKVQSTLRQKHRGAILSLITFAVGWVVGLKISVFIGAYLILIAIPLLIYWIMSEDIIRNRIIKIFKRLPNKAQLYTILTLVLMALSIIVIRVPIWSNVVSFLAPGSDSYIIQTTSHKDGQYNLLVECGVGRSKTYNIDTVAESIIIVTNHSWTDTIEKWWDYPHRKSRSENAVYPLNSIIYQNISGGIWTTTPPISNEEQWIKMSAIIIYEDIEHPPEYSLAYNVVPISNDRSLYILFKSSEPIRIKIARLNNCVFYAVGTKMIPYYR